jgi:hypothetical protein
MYGEVGGWMNLGVLVPILDLVAFFLITPEIFGPERIEAFLHWLDALQELYLRHLKRVLFPTPKANVVPERTPRMMSLVTGAIATILCTALVGLFLAKHEHLKLLDAFLAAGLAAAVNFGWPFILRLVLRTLLFMFRSVLRRGVIVFIAIVLFVCARGIDIYLRLNE